MWSESKIFQKGLNEIYDVARPLASSASSLVLLPELYLRKGDKIRDKIHVADVAKKVNYLFWKTLLIPSLSRP